MELRGKTVVITGGSKGIGLACAEAFAAEGCDLLLSARDPAGLDTAAASLRARFQVGVRVLAADLSADAEREKLHAMAPDADILVNNAGAIPSGGIADISVERWKAAWDLKVFGYIHLCQLFLPAMLARKSGVIVNIIGVSPFHPTNKNVAGAAGNAALMALTECMGTGSLDDGVRVVGINPGATETQRQVVRWKARAQVAFGDENRWRELTTNFPLGRLARVDEVADMAVFLASERASYVSGTMISVDGGSGSSR
jgi:NAD(P)-dependent dehydrogenase (short-subunit alcohol dehydrogenase family)